MLKNLWGIKTQDIELLCDIQKPIFNDDDENPPNHEDSLFNNVQIGQKKLEHKDAQPYV